MLGENLRNIRLAEGLNQNEMATKLGYDSVNGYAKIERGESYPKSNKLKEIAKILNIDISELMKSHEINNTVNITGNCHYGSNVILLSETQCANELEKAQLLLKEKDKEIDYLKAQNKLQQEMFEMFKLSKQVKGD
jgi:transcriptional regulator with XRE-family HTH domain